MPLSSDLIEQINAHLASEFEIDSSKLTESANIKETLELDSLDYVDLVVIIESNFNFKVKQEDFIGIQTFGDLYNYIHSKISMQ